MTCNFTQRRPPSLLTRCAILRPIILIVVPWREINRRRVHRTIIRVHESCKRRERLGTKLSFSLSTHACMSVMRTAVLLSVCCRKFRSQDLRSVVLDSLLYLISSICSNMNYVFYQEIYISTKNKCTLSSSENRFFYLIFRICNVHIYIFFNILYIYYIYKNFIL